MTREKEKLTNLHLFKTPSCYSRGYPQAEKEQVKTKLWRALAEKTEEGYVGA